MREATSAAVCGRESAVVWAGSETRQSQLLKPPRTYLECDEVGQGERLLLLLLLLLLPLPAVSIASSLLLVERHGAQQQQRPAAASPLTQRHQRRERRSRPRPRRLRRRPVHQWRVSFGLQIIVRITLPEASEVCVIRTGRAKRGESRAVQSRNKRTIPSSRPWPVHCTG